MAFKRSAVRFRYAPRKSPAGSAGLFAWSTRSGLAATPFIHWGEDSPNPFRRPAASDASAAVLLFRYHSLGRGLPKPLPSACGLRRFCGRPRHDKASACYPKFSVSCYRPSTALESVWALTVSQNRRTIRVNHSYRGLHRHSTLTVNLRNRSLPGEGQIKGTSL